MSAQAAGDAQRLDALDKLLRAKISAAGGWLDFESFMQTAMHEPGLGYYAAGPSPLGSGGDFVTAPELGDLFAGCLAGFTAACLPDGGKILEIGAGSGKLAAGIMRSLAERGCSLPDYLILETGGALQRQQDELLGAGRHAKQYRWLKAMPQRFCGVVVANEVLDALPCQVLVCRQRQWHHYGVGIDNGGSFVWLAGPHAKGQLAAQLAGLEADEGRVVEFNRQAQALTSELVGCLERGVLLVVDYGFARKELWHRDRRGGSVLAHVRHKVSLDVLENPGGRDLTCHVDFTAIAEAAASAGGTPAGFTTQASFLLDLGILDGGQSEPNTVQMLRRSQQLQTLLMPHEMGDLFKVLAITRGEIGVLPGFGMRNRIGELAAPAA